MDKKILASAEKQTRRQDDLAVETQDADPAQDKKGKPEKKFYLSWHLSGLLPQIHFAWLTENFPDLDRILGRIPLLVLIALALASSSPVSEKSLASQSRLQQVAFPEILDPAKTGGWMDAADYIEKMNKNDNQVVEEQRLIEQQQKEEQRNKAIAEQIRLNPLPAKDPDPVKKQFAAQTLSGSAETPAAAESNSQVMQSLRHAAQTAGIVVESSTDNTITLAPK